MTAKMLKARSMATARRYAVPAMTGLVGAMVLGVMVLDSFAAAATPPPKGFADLVEKVVPAVVNISSRHQAAALGFEGRPDSRFPRLPEGSPFKDYFDRFFGTPPSAPGAPRRRPDVRSQGSGFIVDADGYIVTNNHVLGTATDLTVILNDGTEHAATLIGRDDKTDLALLKIDAGKPLPTVEFGDSDAVRVGDWAIAVGNPFGLGGTVTMGIISARNRQIGAGPYHDFLQLDAAINRGNSGGPSFNAAGQVIGINTAIFSPTGRSVGIGFAIPSNVARSVIDQLREHGKVERGWLGVRIQTVTPEIAGSLDLGDRRGVLIAEITPDSPAQAAGVRQDDVILRFAGKLVEDARALARAVAATKPGSQVKLMVWRQDRNIRLDVAIGRQPDGRQLAAAKPDGTATGETDLARVGLTVAALTPERRDHFAIADGVSGVVVTSVRPDSSAGERGMRPGDVIVAVGHEPVETPDQVALELTDAAAVEHDSVLFLVWREGRQHFVPVRLRDI